MIKMRYIFVVGFGLILFLSGIHAGASENLRNSFDAESQKDIQKGLVDQQIRIMPQLNAIKIGLGWFNDLNYYYEKSLSKIFFQDHIIEAKISEIDFNGANISVKLFHPVYGFGNITFVFDENFIARTSDDVIQGILQNTLGDGNHRYVFGNPHSRRYHLFNCLHSQENSQLIRMSKAEADNQGYQPGGFCFKKIVYLPDLAIERRIEIQWLARLREHALLMGSSPKQDAVDKLGRKILKNWPIQLLGYNYSFHLIYSQRMITMATPTGKIFITTALMDALESEQEVEALLARAIAHVENRHSLKQYYSKMKADKNEQFIQTLTSAAGSFAGIFAGAASGAIKAFGNLPFLGSSSDNPSGLGYEIDLEKEADAVAALYFDYQQKDKRHLSAAIKKLELAPLYFNFENEESFDLNTALSNFEITEMTKQLFPGEWDHKKDIRINDRAKRAQDIKFKYFDEDSSFILQKGRRLPVQLAMKYQSLVQDENKVMVYISDKSFLPNRGNSNKSSRVTLFVTDKQGKHRFKLLWRYITEDMWGARLIFEAPREKRGRFIAGAQDLEIEILEFQGPADKGNDRKITLFNFVKGRLEPENRMADLHQSDF